MFTGRFGCREACTADGKAGEGYTHVWTLGDPANAGEFSWDGVMAYTFNDIDRDGNDATPWFNTIGSLYPVVRVLLTAVDTAGVYNNVGVTAVTAHPDGTHSIGGGVLVSSGDPSGDTYFAYTVAGSPRNIQSGTVTCTSATTTKTFTPPFSGTPNIQATVASLTSATVSVTNISATQFDVTLTPAPTTLAPVDVSWLATLI